MEAEELKQIAAQLKHPSGEHGIGIAHMMNETNIGMTRHSIQRLDLQEGDHVLELGHGNCGHLEYLMSQKKGLTYHGLEISTLMHEEAKKAHGSLVNEDLAHFALYDGLNIPFSDNQFDKIFTVNTIYFWSDPTALLSEIHRVLKAGGKFNITFAHEDFMEQLPFTKFEFKLYSIEKMKQLIEKSPFKITGADTQTETVRSKTGEMMDRDFTTITLEK